MIVTTNIIYECNIWMTGGKYKKYAGVGETLQFERDMGGVDPRDFFLWPL
jgi:hypothetical protein